MGPSDRFFKLRGQCLVPSFYSRVATRGLNSTMLSSDDMIKTRVPATATATSLGHGHSLGRAGHSLRRLKPKKPFKARPLSRYYLRDTRGTTRVRRNCTFRVPGPWVVLADQRKNKCAQLHRDVV